MSALVPTESELADAIETATRSAVENLFVQHPEHYYYICLITTGEALTPVLAAWSEEAFEQAVKAQPDKARAVWLKWSWADSPYLSFGEQFFEPVRKLFDLRPKIDELDPNAWKSEYDTRLRAMETAMSRLDRQGVFRVGEARAKVVITVEVAPPDYTNTLRAKRLNPPEALHAWLEEAAEKE